MPFPWDDIIAEDAGSFNLVLNLLTNIDTTFFISGVPSTIDGAHNCFQFGIGASYVAWETIGDTSLGESIPPDFLCVKGFQTDGGSVAVNTDNNYGALPDTDVFGAFVSVIQQENEMFVMYGGRLSDSSFAAHTLGLENYFYWRHDFSNWFDGGNTAVAMPVWKRIVLDWGNDAPDVTLVRYMSAIPCPTGVIADAAAIHIEQRENSSDPNDFNKRIIGIILGPHYADDETLTFGLTSCNVVASDDGVNTKWSSGILFNDTLLSDADDFTAFSFFALGSRTTSDSDHVFNTNIFMTFNTWTPTPLYTSVGVPGPADCEIRTPKWRDLPESLGVAGWHDIDTDFEYPFSFPNGDFFITQGCSRGWIGWYYKLIDAPFHNRAHWILTSKDMTTWQEIIPRSNDGAACAYITSGNQPNVNVDVHGRWIFQWSAFTFFPTQEDQDNDTNGVDYPAATFYADEGEAWNGFECPSDPTPPVEDDLYDPVASGPGSVLIRAWTFEMDGHRFYVLKLGEDGTIVYDETSEFWYEWQSGDSTEGWQAWVGMNWETIPIAGDWNSGQVWDINPTVQQDDDARITRVCVGYTSTRLYSGVPCNGALLIGSTTVDQTGDANIRLRTSDDNGITWLDHGIVNVANGGEHDEFAISWLSLGTIRQPGRVFEITDAGAAYRIDSLDTW